MHHLSCHSDISPRCVSLYSSPPEILKPGHVAKARVEFEELEVVKEKNEDVEEEMLVVKQEEMEDVDEVKVAERWSESMAFNGTFLDDDLDLDEECIKKENDVYACNFNDSLDGHIRKKKTFECSQCSKKFRKMHNLKRHDNAVHKKLKPYQCEEVDCLAKFNAKSQLNTHMKICHLDDRAYMCPQPGCAERFVLKVKLQRHMMKVHNFEKPYSCVENDCPQRFVERRLLEDHLRSVHGAEKLSCDIGACTSTFTFSTGLHVHKKKHHPNTVQL